MNPAHNPTIETYDGLREAYDFFNARLFGDALPSCLITLQRHKRTYGYFSPKRFVRRSGEVTDEIAMNPAFFATRSIPEVLSTLVHEMVHLWQEKFGTPGRGRYHNKEWASAMETIGLIPSRTGNPGGKKTGDRVTHYIQPGGPFEVACQVLVTKRFVIEWLDTLAEKAPSGGDQSDDETGLASLGIQTGGKSKTGNRSNRTKYTHRCTDGNSVNVWGKAELLLYCGRCGEHYQPVE